MKLSIETKVAIAVATGFVVLIVGAIAQGSRSQIRLFAF
jgi:hypothetical protein